jgi:hypothetical protein
MPSPRTAVKDLLYSLCGYQQAGPLPPPPPPPPRRQHAPQISASEVLSGSVSVILRIKAAVSGCCTNSVSLSNVSGRLGKSVAGSAPLNDADSLSRESAISAAFLVGIFYSP